MITFDQIKSMWKWDAIPNCPGRFKLGGGASTLLIEDLLGIEVDAQTYIVPTARDEVFVAVVSDFGIVSYRSADGSFIHTLNTLDGLHRKLVDLGIEH